MSKEILEYKVWDKVRKVMYGPDELYTIEFHRRVVTGVNKDGWEFTISFGDIELLQYTGTIDKTKAKIYRGDIVRFFDDRIAEVIWDVRLARFSTGELGYEESALTYDDEIEVIGSKYQDPELLK